ncbi:MAG: hypothetical protein P8N55_06465 [Flavobacteriaceae bacterium]|nr:hypothetical protein [Flavobacteriaceae bacterium]
MITNMYLKYYLIIFLGIVFPFNSLASQETKVATKNFYISWQKANGDQYEIPVENNLKVKILKQRVNRALMQILLKSSAKSKDFETFDPYKITLLTDVDYQVAKVDFTILDNSNGEEKYTYYFSFDTDGNVFKQLYN